MNNKKQTNCDGTWELEFHKYKEGFDISGAGVGLGFLSFYKDIFVLLKIRKIAKIKRSKLKNCNKIQVQCPYCQNVSIQPELTRNYRCPFCYKKSYISTSIGLFTLFTTKKINKIVDL